MKRYGKYISVTWIGIAYHIIIILLAIVGSVDPGWPYPNIYTTIALVAMGSFWVGVVATIDWAKR